MEGRMARLKTLWHTERTEQGEGEGEADWKSFRHGELFLPMES